MVLLTLTAPQGLEAALLDALLEQDAIASLHSMPARRHGTAPAALSVAERVAGAQRSVRIEALLREDAVTPLLTALGQRFPSAAEVRFRITPVSGHGSL